MIETFLATHALFAGFLSLLQVGVLPGLLLARLWPQISGWLLLPLVLAVSLVVNFQLTFYMTLMGIYRIESVALIVLLITALLIRTEYIVKSPSKTGQPSTDNHHSLVLHFLGFAAAASALWELCRVLWGHLPGVFEAWDAVVSWNRWAIDWYGGRLPISTYGYPQLIPSAWANTYIWLGSDEIEFFARGLMAAFPLAVISIFLDMYWRFRWPAALFAIALWCIALLRVFPYIADSGYVDVPIAFFVSLTGYLLFLGRRQVLNPSIALWLAAVTATGAILTKQAGAIAVAMLVWGLLDRRGNPISRGEWHRATMLAIILFLVLTLPWFGYKFYQIAVGIDPSNVSYVTSDIYQGETLLARLWRATTITIPQTLNNPILSIYIPTLVLGVIALRSSLGRVCWLGVVLPYYLLWALFFSYDLRNFMPAVPFVCLGLSLGLQSLWPNTGTPLSSPKQLFVNMLPQLRWRSGVTLILTVSIATLVMTPTVSRNDLITLNEQRHLEAEDPPLNKLLLNYAKKSESAGMIITTYTPVVSTPRLREHFFSVPAPASLPKAFTVALKESQPLCHILTMMPRHHELRYLLFHTNIYPEIINAAINDGSLRIIFQTANVRFFEIACSFNSNSTIKSDEHLTTFPIHHD